jgi:hypothetical protein
MIENSWTNLREHLHGVGRSVTKTKGLLENEPAMDRLLEDVRELGANHPGGWGAFREGALAGLLRLAVNQDYKLDVRPLVRLGFAGTGDTAARRSWWKVLGRDLYLELDELVEMIQRWQRHFTVDVTYRFDPVKTAEAWVREPVKIAALVATLRHRKGRQGDVGKFLGADGARVIWKE